MSVPRPIAVFVTRVMFLPTLYWNRFWRALIPRKQRWWDRIDNNIILGIDRATIHPSPAS